MPQRKKNEGKNLEPLVLNIFNVKSLQQESPNLEQKALHKPNLVEILIERGAQGQIVAKSPNIKLNLPGQHLHYHPEIVYLHFLAIVGLDIAVYDA